MIDLDAVIQLCQRAVRPSGGVVIDAVRDPLDGSLWVRLSSWPRAQEAAAVLIEYGLAVVDRRDCRLQVTGWDARVLRRRLGTVMAGVDDLRSEWEATAELARYHRDRRSAVSGQDPDDLEVLADVERTLRDAVPLPHTASGSRDVETLLQLIEAGESEYQRLIQAHVDHAEQILREDRRNRTALGGVA